MQKETVKKLLIALIILIIIIITLFLADVYKILNLEEPIFSIKKNTYNESVEYLGLGYKIFVTKNKKQDIEGLKFGTIFSTYTLGDEKND